MRSHHVSGDAITFKGFDSGRQGYWFFQGLPGGGEQPDRAAAQAMDRAHWRHYRDSLACSYPDRSGDLPSKVKIADFYSVRQ